MRLATLVSPDDWGFNFGTAGKQGWRHIVERCARVGIRRIYWRVTTGWSYYASRINNTGPVYDEQTIKRLTQLKRWWYYEPMDWSKDDTFGAATEWARRQGLELFAWLTLENAHGLGTRTRLAQEHPEMMTVDRCGKQYSRLHGWAFPEVRRWWLDIVREIVAYNPDGVLLDLSRMAYVTDPLIRGVSSGGYEEPMVAAFRKETGRDPFEIPNDDPQWVMFRARYFTIWVQHVHTLLSAQPKPMELSVLLYPPGAFRCISPSGELTVPAEKQDNPADDIMASVAVSPLKDRFADLDNWSKNGWVSQVSLVDQFPRSDPSTWKLVRFDGPPWFNFEPYYSRGESFGRQTTAEERRKARGYFDQLSHGKLKCSWCVNPNFYENPKDLREYILTLAEEGFTEANIDESNLLMQAANDRWEAVEKASKEVAD